MTSPAPVAPPKTKSQALRSFDVADFPALTGREEEWRFTPLKRLRGLTDGATSGAAPKYEYSDLPAGKGGEPVVGLLVRVCDGHDPGKQDNRDQQQEHSAVRASGRHDPDGGGDRHNQHAESKQEINEGHRCSAYASDAKAWFRATIRCAGEDARCARPGRTARVCLSLDISA